MIEEEKFAKFCPRCGSKRIKIAITPWKVSSAFFNNYYCEECKFEGYILEGDAETINEFRRNLDAKIKKEGKND